MPTLVGAVPAATAVVKPEWRELTVVFRRPAGNVVAVDGWAYGTLAIHPTWDDPALPPVTITHLRSLLAVARVADADQAVERVEWLWDRCRTAWLPWEVQVSTVPEEVLQWLQKNQ